MANIRVDLDRPVATGLPVTFRSPVDCSVVTGLIVYYPISATEDESMVFQFADAHGSNVGNIDNLFSADAIVKVVLDVENAKAYVQNADTNAYLEGKFKAIDEEFDSGSLTMTWGNEKGKFEMLLTKKEPYEVGPYCQSGVNRLISSENESYIIYDSIAKATSTYHAGRYSYGFYNKYYAYKIDHVTKTAELLCDLSSYVGTTKGKDFDRILVVDDKYIYFVKHLVCPVSGTRDDHIAADECYGTIYKFNHDGTLAASRDSAKTSADSWVVELKDGFSSDTDSYTTIFNGGTFYQTKNYILWTRVGTATSTSGSKHYFYFAISKSGLSVVSGGYMFWCSSFGTPKTCVSYDSDIFFVNNNNGYDEAYALYNVYKLTDTTPSASSGYILGGSGSTPIANKLDASYAYYLRELIPFYDHSVGKCYYKMTLWLRSSSSSEYGVYYTVVSEDDFDPATGKFTIKYVTSTNLNFGASFYDPVLRQWNYRGHLFEVYPAYVPPDVSSVTLVSGFTETPFPIVNNKIHLIKSDDKYIYTMGTEPVYLLERVQEVQDASN